MNNFWSKIALCLALILFAAASVFPVAEKLSDPAYYADCVASIDEKTQTVLKLTAASTLASAGISAIPGDTATPIAEKLADFSEYFLLILCVLYAEKFLLTVIPLGVCRVLVPIACALFLLGRFRNPRGLDRLGGKLLLVGLLLVFVIPISQYVSDQIYTRYQDSIESVISSAETLDEETAELAATQDSGVIQGILNRLSETTESLTDRASNTLNRFIETLAIMIVTSCLIPVLVLVFFLWIIKLVSGIELREFLPPRLRREREARQEHAL